MDARKLSATLADRLDHADAADLVEVVVELQAAPPAGTGDGMPRAARIAAARDAFGVASYPVERAIQSAGGEVVDAAWINQTVRAKLPASAVASLVKLHEVRLLDLPRTLTADWG